jgi:hypothetical protein
LNNLHLKLPDWLAGMVRMNEWDDDEMSHDLLVALRDIAGDDALAVLNHFLNSNTEHVLEKSELFLM